MRTTRVDPSLEKSRPVTYPPAPIRKVCHTMLLSRVAGKAWPSVTGTEDVGSDCCRGGLDPGSLGPFIEVDGNADPRVEVDGNPDPRLEVSGELELEAANEFLGTPQMTKAVKKRLILISAAVRATWSMLSPFSLYRCRFADAYDFI